MSTIQYIKNNEISRKWGVNLTEFYHYMPNHSGHLRILETLFDNSVIVFKKLFVNRKSESK